MNQVYRSSLTLNIAYCHSVLSGVMSPTFAVSK